MEAQTVQARTERYNDKRDTLYSSARWKCGTSAHACATKGVGAGRHGAKRSTHFELAARHGIEEGGEAFDAHSLAPRVWKTAEIRHHWACSVRYIILSGHTRTRDVYSWPVCSSH